MSASRAVLTAIRATRPIERVRFRVKTAGSSSKGAAGAATRVLRSSSFSHSVMWRMPLLLALRDARTSSQVEPIGEMAAMPVTTTRRGVLGSFIRKCLPKPE